MKQKKLLEVNDLVVQFKIDEEWFSAVKGISFFIRPSEVVGIIGESGCGKSVTAFSLLRLLPKKKARIKQGAIKFQGENIDSLEAEQFYTLRGDKIAMIFQDPLSCLNPVLNIKSQLLEMWRGQDKKIALTKIITLLKQVGLSDFERILHSYPHQLSGGIRQRIMIAMSLLLEPDLLIADEPTTALDVTVQAQILHLLNKLQKEKKMSLLLITHDIGVISQMCDFVYVMYAGKIVEQGKVEQIFSKPRHPYTKGLIDAIFYEKKTKRLATIPGKVPAINEFISGCPFSPRCTRSKAICSEKHPELVQTDTEHSFACYYPY